MKKLNNKMKVYGLMALASIVLLASCNKDLETLDTIPPVPYAYSPTTVNTIAATIAGSPNDSLFYKLMQRSGQLSIYADTTKQLTLFAVDNAGMRIFVSALAAQFGVTIPASGAPESVYVGFINNSILPADAAGILFYHTVGQAYPTSTTSNAFPNYPLPTFVQLPSAPPFAKLPIFPANNSTFKYVNDIPVFVNETIAKNGVINHTYTIVAPPQKTMRTLIASEATLKFFRSAILRADVGQVVKPNSDSTNFLNYLLGYGVTNLTVLTPNDAAMQPVLKGILTQAYVGGGYSLFSADSLANLKSSVDSLNSPTAGFNILPPANVRGLLAYHILATDTGSKCKPNIRVFSVNVPTTPTFVKTLVNSAPFPASLHPGVLASATFAGPVASSVTFTGFKIVGTSAVPSGPAANVVKKDNHGANGVYHIIDRVLLPQ
jgi:hypothetical protein